MTMAMMIMSMPVAEYICDDYDRDDAGKDRDAGW